MNAEKAVKLSIIIVNYKNESLTIKYIKNELSKVTIDHNIIIVNNEATEKSNKILTEELNGVLINDINSLPTATSSSIYIINNPQNSGFARGNNIGTSFALNIATPEFILFTNNDIKLKSKNAVEVLIDKLKSLPQAGIIGPKVTGLDGEPQSPEPFTTFWDKHIWMLLSSFFYSKKKKIERFKLNYSKQAKEGFHYKVMGSFFIVKTKDFLKCNMMDPHTFLYAEEMILSERMKSIGKKVYYEPSVEVIHEHGATTHKHIKWKKGSDIGFTSECYYYQQYIKTPKWEIYIGKFIHFIYTILR